MAPRTLEGNFKGTQKIGRYWSILIRKLPKEMSSRKDLTAPEEVYVLSELQIFMLYARIN